jgi:L-alanine-DL-glutamate epimerase-like enolase superfamily enzyme
MNWQVHIADTSAKQVAREIHVPFSISSETLNAANFVLVQIRDDNGLRGIGEASPFPTLTGDNVNGVFPVVLELLDQLTEMSALSALRYLRGIREEMFATSPSAYVGVEMALWDLYAKQLGVPLAAIWGGRLFEKAVTDITLPIMSPQAVGDFWRLYSDHNFEVIKIKVSGHVDDDLELINAITKSVPRTTQFTLDGNQGYRFDTAKQLLSRLTAQNFRPLFFEQPLPADDWDGLRLLEDVTGTPVCLDETVVTPEHAIRAVRDRIASMINLKIMKSGIEETARIIAIARSAGIALMIGGMLESEIAMCASLHLACGYGGIQHFDLDTPFFLKKLTCQSSPWHAGSAQLLRPSQPGLGLNLASDLADI